MGIVFMLMVIGNIYVIVYCRLMVGHWRERTTGHREAGLLAALSYASRDGLPAEGLKYFRRYWMAVGALVLLLLAGTATRLDAVRAAFA